MDGTIYTISDQLILSADSTVLEWTGISPDFYIPVTINDFEKGVDPVIDYALQFIRHLPIKNYTLMN